MKDERTLYQIYLMGQKVKQNRGARGTDSERLKCYRSEWTFAENMTLQGKPIPTFSSIKDAERFAKKIYKSKTWPKLFAESGKEDFMNLFKYKKPEVVLKARSTGRGNAGSTNGHVVTLDAKCGMDAYTLIHELTHCLGHMHHGRSFRQALIRMTGTFLGADYKKELKSCFKAQKLNCGDAKKPMEFDRWVETKKRMERIRG
jgi:hypothetical protein|tara:strand:+ start:1605 stop:2210 length:606 start_codon:yes stop_codon:yes gene_type:complete